MNVTFTAEPMPKPEGMTLSQSLAWNYFDFGRTWQAFETQDGSVIVTDESLSLSESGIVFYGLDGFLEWLEDATEDHMKEGGISGNRSFLSGTVKLPEEMITPAIADAFRAALRVEEAMLEQKRAAAIEHLKTVCGTGEFITGE